MKLHNYGAWIYCETNDQWYRTAEEYIEFLKGNRSKTHWVAFYVNGVVQKVRYYNGKSDMESLLENKPLHSLVSPLRAWIKVLGEQSSYLLIGVTPTRMD